MMKVLVNFERAWTEQFGEAQSIFCAIYLTAKRYFSCKEVLHIVINSAFSFLIFTSSDLK